ncbi:malonic semialdehyde reductase [Granulosicoccus antarcticus]|uniref:Putative malonic semialdehyde reductase RutE n=1 Tax=Granulosicoccus antarcticus IMCC3135 TaxID=1192854 RepID=A0A2Z2NXD3_9GAMM|nr:malonic semialdehyde reductase [Granulosicoccus antarcticus]ASJ76112.1 putative malonic semialdehyde reductase RutE [Granulosicoccus antarcticus IMCC3135]
MSSPNEHNNHSTPESAQASVRALRTRMPQVDPVAIDVILRAARSHYAWTDRQVSDDTLRELYDITAAGPTSMNTCPARFVFVKSEEARTRLAKSLKDKNIDKMMSAPVAVIIAFDLDFWKELPFLFPHEDRRGFFKGKEQHCYDTAFRNSSLQAAYFMIAARSLGLDVGAMSGFSNQIVDEEFFADTSLRSNFLCNLGYADESAIFQRLPRFSFEQACSFV